MEFSDLEIKTPTNVSEQKDHSDVNKPQIAEIEIVESEDTEIDDIPDVHVYSAKKLPYNEHYVLSYMRYKIESLLVTNPRLYLFCFLCKSLWPRTLLLGTMYTGILIVINLCNNGLMFIFGLSIAFLSTPFVILWLASLRWMDDFKLKLQATKNTRYRNGLGMLFVLWLFPPIGCIFVALAELFAMIVDILKGLFYLITAQLVLIDENTQATAFKQFRGKICCFTQTIPMLAIQIYILVTNSNKVNVDVLHVSIAFSILHIVYNLYKLNQHAKYNGINIQTFCVVVLFFLLIRLLHVVFGSDDLPIAKLVPRLGAINNNNSENEERRVVKIVFFGSSSSGKSALFQQIKIIQGSQFKEIEKTDCRQAARANLFWGTLALLEKSHELYQNDPVKYKKCKIDMNDYDIARQVQVLESFHGQTFREPNEKKKQSKEEIEKLKVLGQCIGEFWSHTGIQTAFKYRTRNCIFPTNIDYFFDKSKQIFSKDYIPNDEDIVKVNIPTQGVVRFCYRFSAKSPKYELFDLGGRRIDRNTCLIFENATAIVFTASLSSFAEVLLQNANYNAMIESIRVFYELRNCKWFNKTDIFIFFTKLDEFKRLILEGASIGDDCFKEQHDWGYLYNSARDANGDVINPDFDEKANKEMYISDNRYPMWKPNECKDQLEYNGPKELKTDKEKEIFDECIENQLQFIKNAYLAQIRKGTIGNTYHYTVSVTNKDHVKAAWDDMHQKTMFHHLYPIGVDTC